MPDLRELYQELILDHSKNPRNYRKLESANRTAEGYNPLCGDHFHLYLRVEGDRIAEITFEGSGCALSKASASMMTSTLKGKTTAEAESLFDRFHAMVIGKNGTRESATGGEVKSSDGGNKAATSNGGTKRQSFNPGNKLETSKSSNGGNIDNLGGFAGDKQNLGKLAVFSGVSEFPVRVKCVSLAWHTLVAALKGEQQPVTTE